MRVAKPLPLDIHAAGELMALLIAVSNGYYPGNGNGDDDDDDEPTWFDQDDPNHLLRLYEKLSAIVELAPGFPTRVIGGMCYVICWDQNQILDPADDCLALHPDLVAGLALLNRERADFLPRLEREARMAVADTIERAAARHLAEMKGGAQ